MKINIIESLHPLYNFGGGEAIVKAIVQEGIKLGHQFFYETLYPRARNFNNAADITFLIDIFNRPKGRRKINKRLISKVIKKGNFIHFDNAYVDSCNLDYLPCNGHNSNICPYKKNLKLIDKMKMLDFNNICFNSHQLIKNMYKLSKLNIFLSPLHKRVIEEMLNLNTEKSFVLKPIIDNNLFNNKNLKRDIDNLFVGAIGEAKGFENLKKNYSDSITMIGACRDGIKLDFGNYLGTVPYSEIPNYMNRAKKFIFHPRWPEPQGRVVVEAALCGCELDTNNNVGATSFPFDLSNPDNFSDSLDEFWKTINTL